MLKLRKNVDINAYRLYKEAWEQVTPLLRLLITYSLIWQLLRLPERRWLYYNLRRYKGLYWKSSHCCYCPEDCTELVIGHLNYSMVLTAITNNIDIVIHTTMTTIIIHSTWYVFVGILWCLNINITRLLLRAGGIVWSILTTNRTDVIKLWGEVTVPSIHVVTSNGLEII